MKKNLEILFKKLDFKIEIQSIKKNLCIYNVLFITQYLILSNTFN